MMNKEEALALKSFKHYCNCGGFAYELNGRNPASPHMDWCPQAEEYAEWYAAIHEEEK